MPNTDAGSNRLTELPSAVGQLTELTYFSAHAVLFWEDISQLYPCKRTQYQQFQLK